MSHFVVLVIGDRVEQQLAPYHEFECTGIEDEYVQSIDVTEKARAEFERSEEAKGFAEFCENYYGHKVIPFGGEVDLSKKHKFGYTVVGADGEVIKTIDRTNPNSKWDWYKIGGRWNGYFKVKQHASNLVVVGEPGLQCLNKDYQSPSKDRADQCLKGDIDLEGMGQDAAAEAAKQYDLYMATVNGLPKVVTWSEMRAKHPDSIEAARKEYHAQPAVKALHANEGTFWLEPEKLSCTREEYIDRARKGVMVSFAVVKDGKWYERGEMGWWGCAHNEKDRDEWNNQFSSLFDSLPDDTLLTIVDCHI